MDLRGKNAVVTGGNSGIGFVTARELARGGARVILACRNEAKAGAAAAEIARATGNGRIEVARLDLASFASARACADELSAKLDRLDILVNNAGTYTQGDETTADGIHPTMQANYFGPYLFTRLLLPLLSAAPLGTDRECELGDVRRRRAESRQAEFPCCEERLFGLRGLEAGDDPLHAGARAPYLWKRRLGKCPAFGARQYEDHDAQEMVRHLHPGLRRPPFRGRGDGGEDEHLPRRLGYRGGDFRQILRRLRGA